MTARKLSELIRKHRPTPATAMSTPASAGPTMREALNRLEFNAIALGSSSRPTIWMVNDCRAGVSKMVTMPLTPASRYTSHTAAWAVSASAASVAALSMNAVCVTISRRR